MPPESGLGVQTLLRNVTSPDHPFSFAETPSGLLLMANGIDPMLKWDGLAQVSAAAGVKPPATALELGGTGLGYITGKLVAYQRFIDVNGNPSDLSPVSNLMVAGKDGFVQDVNYDRTTGLVTVRSSGHGLTGTQALAIDGVAGLSLVNGQWTATVVDEDTFTINALSVATGLYSEGGVWTMGIKTILYGAVPVPTEEKVARRQILRNLSGNVESLYVDVDTADLAGTAFASQADDAALARGIAVPLTYGDDDLPHANRNGVPPSHKSVIASHKGRIYATADAEYSAGHAEVLFNRTQIQGVGTDWRATFVGRSIYLDGASSYYGITDVDEAAQVITIDRPFFDAPRPFTEYTIRPESGERRLVYYTEPGLAESWPAYNALAIPETNDTIVGLLSLGQYLYILERRNIHRLTFQGDPQDGYTFLAATRGSINNRTYAVADNKTYFLDEIGIHKFDGQESESISQPIQNLFQTDGFSDLEVDWEADQSLWHAAHDPVRDTIRWFVNMVGQAELVNAICYNYRTDRWWLEEYPTPMTASTNTTFGARRSLCGTDARRVLCLSEGSYDGVDGTGTLRGTATSADSTSLTDSSASFEAVEGAPITIVEGAGRGQTRIIASVSATSVEIILPWGVIPDWTSIYQIGGIPWRWRSGWFRFVDHEEDVARDVELVFKPTSVATTLDLLLYYDHDTSPRVWARDIEQDGVRTIAGDPHITVDLDTKLGWARQRIGGHAGTYSSGDTFVSLEMSGVQAGDPVRISQVVLNDVETP
jgi:hypothetical protein